MANEPFHNPTDFGCFDLATSQVAKQMVFDWDAAVSADAKIVITLRKRLVRTYTVGDGLTLSNTDQTVTLSLDGADYESMPGNTLDAACSFFIPGDIELTFTLLIVDSPL